MAVDAAIPRLPQPIRVERSGALRSRVASSAVNQFPARTPWRFAPRMRAMPAASAGARQPLSAASEASLRRALRCRLTVEAAKPCRSSSLAVALQGGLAEAGPSHPGVPGAEAGEGQGVAAAGMGGLDGVEDQGHDRRQGIERHRRFGYRRECRRVAVGGRGQEGHGGRITRDKPHYHELFSRSCKPRIFTFCASAH